MPKIQKKYIFKETCAIVMPTRGSGFKNRNFREYSPKKRGLQNDFSAAGPRLPHNLH